MGRSPHRPTNLTHDERAESTRRCCRAYKQSRKIMRHVWHLADPNWMMNLVTVTSAFGNGHRDPWVVKGTKEADREPFEALTSDGYLTTHQQRQSQVWHNHGHLFTLRTPKHRETETARWATMSQQTVAVGQVPPSISCIKHMTNHPTTAPHASNHAVSAVSVHAWCATRLVERNTTQLFRDETHHRMEILGLAWAARRKTDNHDG